MAIESKKAETARLNKLKQVEKALKRVRADWDWGVEIRDGDDGKRNFNSRMAAKRGCHLDIIEKLRQIADPKVGYTEVELESLLGRARKNGLAIGTSTLFKFVTVTPKKRLQDFEKLAIRHKWSRRKIQAEILSRFGGHKVKRGGRQANLPFNAEDLLLDLADRCFYWRRLYDLLKRPMEAEATKKKPVRLGDLSEDVRKLLKSAVATLERLEAAIRPLREIGGAKQASRKS